MPTRPLLWIFLAGVLASCATNPAMDRYVERKIDRPFVHADGIRTLSVLGKGSVTHDVLGRETSVPPLPLPFYYTFTLFENVGVEGVLLPVAVHWQIDNSGAGYWGLSGGAGYGTSPYFGFHYDPTVAVTKKSRLDDSLAVKGVWRAVDVIFPDGGPTTFGTDLSLSTEFQPTPWLWAEAGVTVSAVYTSAYSTTQGPYRFWTHEGVTTEFPLFGGLSLTLFRTMDLSAQYSLRLLGRANGTFEHNYTLGLGMAY